MAGNDGEMITKGLKKAVIDSTKLKTKIFYNEQDIFTIYGICRICVLQHFRYY